MTHLTVAEFVDAAEGALPPSRFAHLEACADCRDELAEVLASIAAARAADVPEPSPLYWPHMASRIRERVATETIAPVWRNPDLWPAGWRRALPLASAAVLTLAVIAAPLIMRTGTVPPLEAPGRSVVDASAPTDDAAWHVLTSTADETPIDEAHAAGMVAPAGAVDRAVQQMSPEELRELGQLLQREMKRAGA